MPLNKFIELVTTICLINEPSFKVATEWKADCIKFYSKCAVRDSDTVEELRIRACKEKAKDAEKGWGK